MHALHQEQFNQLIAKVRLKPRLRRELRFINSTSRMSAEDWREAELLCISDRTGKKGVLLLAPDDDLYVIPYELLKGIANRQTGRAQPIICDFCRTWQSGSGAGNISFQKDARSLNSVGFLCCSDLACSQHVRSKTSASRASRAQLREDITNEQRIERLKSRLRQVITDLHLEPIRID
ncbi:MAG TPA: FBP domain-containing protein [Candidatus Saccharimonadales bacterium]